jgi:hypothetical protein
MAYLALKKAAAPGEDGETSRHFGETLEQNLQDLSPRLKPGGYRAKPVELAERMRKVNLELPPEKTRLLEFAPFAIDNRPRPGEGKPETCSLFGCTPIGVKKRSNRM